MRVLGDRSVQNEEGVTHLQISSEVDTPQKRVGDHFNSADSESALLPVALDCSQLMLGSELSIFNPCGP